MARTVSFPTEEGAEKFIETRLERNRLAKIREENQKKFEEKHPPRIYP